MADAASPDTPTDPPTNTGIEETVRLTRAELMSGILVGIGGEHDTVPTQAQLDRAVDMIFRYARRRDRQVAKAIVRELDRLAMDQAPAVADDRRVEMADRLYAVWEMANAATRDGHGLTVDQAARIEHLADIRHPLDAGDLA